MDWWIHRSVITTVLLMICCTVLSVLVWHVVWRVTGHLLNSADSNPFSPEHDNLLKQHYELCEISRQPYNACRNRRDDCVTIGLEKYQTTWQNKYVWPSMAGRRLHWLSPPRRSLCCWRTSVNNAVQKSTWNRVPTWANRQHKIQQTFSAFVTSRGPSTTYLIHPCSATSIALLSNTSTTTKTWSSLPREAARIRIVCHPPSLPQ